MTSATLPLRSVPPGSPKTRAGDTDIRCTSVGNDFLHYVAFDAPAAQLQTARFLATAAAGTATVVAAP